MKVRDVMERNVFTVLPEATYEEAARILCEKDYSGVPVVNNDGKLVGMLSEKDLFRALFPFYGEYHENPREYDNYEDREHVVEDIRRQKVGDFMSKNIITIEPDAPVLRAGAIMLAKGFYRLPVMEEEKLVGLVTREHIYKAIFRKHLKL